MKTVYELTELEKELILLNIIQIIQDYDDLDELKKYLKKEELI